MNLFIKELFNNPIFYFSVVTAFMGSICFQEFCRATMAHYLGDDTARNNGFKTLNPFKVMGNLRTSTYRRKGSGNNEPQGDYR